jgi:uncharacterized repeat protein (TIGR03803 family)
MTTARRSCFPKAVFASCPRLPIVLSCMVLLVMGIAPTPLHSQTYTDLHNFGGNNCVTEGCYPYFPGILAQGQDGNLYGTLALDGAFGGGTVFKITPAGAITTLYNFSNGGPDGSYPTGGLTLGADGNFYGTNTYDGAYGFGTIFKITPTGVLTTLHSFDGLDGGSPHAPPVLGKNGNFYGVAHFAAEGYSIGAAYSITSSGTFKLLAKSIPGRNYAPLILAVDGYFYGTTADGGAFNGGTVFRMSATGTVKIVYSFDGTHGLDPEGPLVQGSGAFLYGTTTAGGSSANAAGVVFKLSTAGAITVLHEFDSTSTTDGDQPQAGLVAATDGNFYGATSAGNPSGSAQYGTLFKITKSGTYSVLHVFDATDGATPWPTPMQHTNGILYGLTTFGGNPNTNGGVFYSLAVGIPPFVSLMPTSGTVGQTVEILGNGLTGTTSVMFGSSSASFTVVGNSYMTAVVPASGMTGTVTVTTPSGTLKSRQIFKVLPIISSFSPTSGPVGTQVTITGTALTGTSKVTFGGVKATAFTVNSGTQVTATVPTGAVTGKVKITTAGGSATSLGTFTVN